MNRKQHWKEALGRVAALGAIALVCVAGSFAAAADGETDLDRVLDRIVEQEAALAEKLAEYRPLVETYLQTVELDTSIGTVPVKDNYFIGRLSLDGGVSRAAAGDESKKKKKKGKTLDLFDQFHSQTFKPEAFARMLMVDRGAFTRENYSFDFLRAEYLGEVRTLVFDVTPTEGKVLNRLRSGRFTGRIWVDDRDFNIVRFNGVYGSVLTLAFHFDSWRLNSAPGLWLPAHVYTEESDRAFKGRKRVHKGQIRIWGYDVDRPDDASAFTQVLIEAPRTEDPTDRSGYVSPIDSARAWESEAENNVLRRLEKAGLLAPRGEVDEVLETVVANLEITNGLDIQPPIRCRVLLTTPIESFTIGHTLVISRGLLDTLPDEASLAMVLAHELGHVISGHELDTSFAFSDRMLVDDGQAMEQFLFERTPEEESVADARAVQLLQNSPYKDDLGKAGLYLKSMQAHAPDFQALIRPHFGNDPERGDVSMRMLPLLQSAPELAPQSVEQIAALPLSGRVKLDPWNARIELMNLPRPALLSAREKMPFQLTPLRPYLARYEDTQARKAAQEARAETDAAAAASTAAPEAVEAAGAPDPETPIETARRENEEE